MNRLPNLDALRFFLATIVIFFHLPQLSHNQGLPHLPIVPFFNRGAEAVYMFFVLSGFLIIRLIYRDKMQDRFSIKKFYIRRVLRIFPLYYLIVIFGFLFYNIILPFLEIPFEIHYKLQEGVLLTVFFLPNIFAKLYTPGGILEILWSIGIEEQFYLMIAPLLFFISKNKVLKFLVVLTFIYFSMFHLDIFSILKEFHFVYFYLFFGGIISILEENNMLEILKKSIIIPIVITIVTILYFFTDVFQFNNLLSNNLFTMVLFGLFVHSLAYNNFGKIIKSSWLTHWGQISYGIYMYHVIVINAVVYFCLKLQQTKIFSDSIMIVMIYILTFVVTIAMAHLSYTYFETYFLKLKNKFR